MHAQVYKIHSDFYYAQDEKHDTFVCKIRDVLKKQKTEIVVGDFVELSDDLNFIIKRLKRKNSLLRPKVANIDLALVVTSFKEPELNLIQLNRYLIYLKYHNIDCAICVNKEDLENDLNSKEDKIEKIYKKLGYKVLFISAKNNIGTDKVIKLVKNKTIALCGLSGVGKTTLINAISPNYSAATNTVSQKTMRGRHTTRHCEIISNGNFNIIDTPGFSCLKFNFILPDELIDLFDDLKKYKNECKYSNCLHDSIENKNCSVVKNLDKIDLSRYQSYLDFLKETIEYKKEISKKSIKKELLTKNSGNKTVTKISKNKRATSRKVQKQSIGEING